jgi:hypothetical protein
MTGKNGTQSSKINGKDNDLEYNLLITVDI